MDCHLSVFSNLVYTDFWTFYHRCFPKGPWGFDSVVRPFQTYLFCSLWGSYEKSHCSLIISNLLKIYILNVYKFILSWSLKKFLSRSWQNIHNMKLLKAKFIHLVILSNSMNFSISKWKSFAIRSIRYWLFLELLL